MTNAQLDVLMIKIATLEHKIDCLNTIVCSLQSFVESIANDKINISKIENELFNLKVIIKSVKEELEV